MARCAPRSFPSSSSCPRKASSPLAPTCARCRKPASPSPSRIRRGPAQLPACERARSSKVGGKRDASGYDCAVAGETSTQYVAYTLYKADPAWLRLPIEERNAGKEAFADVMSAWQDRMEL